MPLVWMSRSAMPAPRRAAITLSICTAFARIAALASAAWVTTPVEMVATSGTRVASAVVAIDSNVPSAAIGGAGGIGDWALACMGTPAARARARARVRNTGMVDSRRMQGKDGAATVAAG